MQSGIVKWCVYISFFGAGFAASDRAADAQTTGSPSFNCALARSEVEHLICALPSLQAKDNAMARQYAATLARNPDNVEAIKKAQIAWWRRRNACVGSAVEMADCVGRSYDTRMNELGGNTAPPSEVTVEPKSLTEADVRRLHDEIGQYAQSRGETEGELEQYLGLSPAATLAMVWGNEQHGGTANGVLRSLEGFKASLNDPEKVKLLECMGVKVYNDPQPRGHPPSTAECNRITQGK
jgi:uncharacterized protein